MSHFNKKVDIYDDAKKMFAYWCENLVEALGPEEVNNLYQESIKRSAIKYFKKRNPNIAYND